MVDASPRSFVKKWSTLKRRSSSSRALAHGSFERFETICVLQRVAQRRLRDRASAVAVVANGGRDAVDGVGREAERRQERTRDVRAAFAREVTLGARLRDVDDIVEERGRDRAAWVLLGREACGPERDAKRVRGVVAGIVTVGIACESAAELVVDRGERGVGIDEGAKGRDVGEAHRRVVVADPAARTDVRLTGLRRSSRADHEPHEPRVVHARVYAASVRALHWCWLVWLLACGSRTGLNVSAAPIDGGVDGGVDASIAPFPCRWGLGVARVLGEAGSDLRATVDETKLAFVRSGSQAWATRDGAIFGPFMPVDDVASLTPAGFLFVDEGCRGLRFDFSGDGELTIGDVPLVTGDRCALGRGDRDAFPLLVSRFGRALVQRVPRDLDAFATVGEAPIPFARIERFALVDEQVYYALSGALIWQDVGGTSQAVALEEPTLDLAVDTVNAGVVVLHDDRASFVARGEVIREVEVAPVFPHLAVSDQEALALGRDGTLWTLPLSRGPARAVERMPPPDDAVVVLAEGHAVGGVASREGDEIVWRPLTCNR